MNHKRIGNLRSLILVTIMKSCGPSKYPTVLWWQREGNLLTSLEEKQYIFFKNKKNQWLQAHVSCEPNKKSWVLFLKKVSHDQVQTPLTLSIRDPMAPRSIIHHLPLRANCFCFSPAAGFHNYCPNSFLYSMPYPPLFSVLSKPFGPLVFNHSLQKQDALILGCLSLEKVVQ